MSSSEIALDGATTWPVGALAQRFKQMMSHTLEVRGGIGYSR